MARPGARPSSGASASDLPSTPETSETLLFEDIVPSNDASSRTRLADGRNGQPVLPLLLRRRGQGRGGPPPSSMLRFVASRTGKAARG